jgi:hypothetical protein
VSDAQAQEEEQLENKIINEGEYLQSFWYCDQADRYSEYKIWKKNSPYLYDLILSTALDWPTLTTQWLPDKKT